MVEVTLQGWGNDEVSDIPGVGAGWLVQSAVVDSNQFTHYENSTSIDSGTHEFDTELTADGSKFVIGEEIAELGYADMEVTEVLVYDRALSETERQQVQSYLNQKYFAVADGSAPEISVEPGSRDFGTVGVDRDGIADGHGHERGRRGARGFGDRDRRNGCGRVRTRRGRRGVHLDPGDSETITVEFAPGSTGAKSAILGIESNDTDESTVEVGLAGTGVNTLTIDSPDRSRI